MSGSKKEIRWLTRRGCKATAGSSLTTSKTLTPCCPNKDTLVRQDPAVVRRATQLVVPPSEEDDLR